MAKKITIQSLVNEADIYRRQGLLNESKAKFMKILELIEKQKSFPKQEQYIKVIRAKIQAVTSEITAIDQADESPDLSDDIQQLISNLWAFSNDENTAALESAVALAEFGQYEKAVAKFQELLDNHVLPMATAKNMIQCHMALAEPEAVPLQFKQWVKQGNFSDEELSTLRKFYLDRLESDQKGSKRPANLNLIESTVAQNQSNKEEVEKAQPVSRHKIVSEKNIGNEPPEDMLEISSVKFQFDQQNDHQAIAEFEVTYQMGDTVCFVVKAAESQFAEQLNPGRELSEIQCFSPVSIFFADGVISDRKKIDSGPREGDFAYRLKLTPMIVKDEI
ncbi:hypothetical protein ACFLZM_06465 [Thermodesulfobacteriota bacterium]